MIRTFEDYKKHYEKWGKCVDQAFPPKNPISEKSLKKRYEKFIKKSSFKKSFKKDEKWEQVREEVFKRDRGECQLLKILPLEYIQELKHNSGGLHKVIDPAHIFNKATYSSLYYDPNNIVCLNRFSHSCLDFDKDPITGESISKEKRNQWWNFIVGEERYFELKKKAYDSKKNRYGGK